MKGQPSNRPDPLMQATALLRESADTELPPLHVVNQTLDALATEQHSISSNPFRRFHMFRKQSWAAAAAIVIASGVGLLWLSQRTAPVAFSAVVDKVRATSAVSFKMVGTTHLPSGQSVKINARMIVGDSSRMRQELPDQGKIVIMDLKAGKQLWLSENDKSAMLIDAGAPGPQGMDFNVLDQFRTFDPAVFKPVGKKEIEDYKASGFRFETPQQSRTVWVDPDTQLPVQIDMTMTGGMMPNVDVVMNEFDWNPTTDETTFSLTPPADYKTSSMQMDMSHPTEKDLLDTFGRLARLNDGKLPDSLDMNALMLATKGVAKQLALAKGQDPQAAKDAAIAEITPLARGLSFVATMTDAHYAGKGVTLNEPGRPIFWYRVAGTDTYHVIDAALQVTAADAAHLPTIDSTPVGATTAPAK
ncbi:MAG: DUF2092 domain-containing protein [Tepidisphaeraceae bacterium]